MLGLVSVIPVCLTEIAGVACFSPRREISSFIITPILLFEDVKKLTARRLVPEKLRWWSRLLCCTRILPKHWKSFSHLALNLCGVTSHSALYYITHKYLPMILSVHWCINISICCVQTSFFLSSWWMCSVVNHMLKQYKTHPSVTRCSLLTQQHHLQDCFDISFISSYPAAIDEKLNKPYWLSSY